MKKIAIKVNNKREFHALMKLYDSKGWKWTGLEKPTNFSGEHDYRDVIEYKDRFSWPSRGCNDYSEYTIIDFSTFSQLTGVEVVNEIVVELKSGIATVKENGIYFSAPMHSLLPEQITEIYTAYKSLSN